MAAETRVFIKFDSNLSKHVQDVNSVRKAYDGLSKGVIDSNGRITKSHEATAKAGIRAYDQYRAGALASIKTISQYHQEWDGKTTKQLVAHIKELQDKRYDENVAYKKGIAEADAVATRIHKNRLEQITLESQALKQLSIERAAVQKGGAGAIIGQLGIGRNLAGIGPLSGITSTLAGLGPIGTAAGAGLAAFGAGAMFAIKQGSDMESTLASLAAQSGLTGSQLDTLRLKAEELGHKFHLSAEDAVDSFRVTINALGLDLTKNTPLLNAMTESVMTLAKASGLTAEEAGGAMGTAFNMFGGDIHQADAAQKFANIMNVLAAGARQARTQIPDLVQELAKFGPVAHQSGLSIEESVSAMEALGHAGIDVSESGNQFKAYIMELSAGSKAGKDALAKLGLTYDDINPTVVGFSKSIHTLKDALDAVYDPTTKIGYATERAAIEHEIFQRRSSALAEAMMQNVDVFDTYTKAVTGTQTAAEMAAARMSTFNDQMAGLWDDVKNVGIDVFFKYKKQIDEIPGALEKTIPKVIAIIDKVEKLAAGVYHVYEAAKAIDAFLSPGTGKDENGNDLGGVSGSIARIRAKDAARLPRATHIQNDIQTADFGPVFSGGAGLSPSEDEKKKKVTKNSLTAYKEYLTAKKEAAKKDKTENDRLHKQEYEDEISFLDTESKHDATNIETDVEDKRSAQQQIYDSKKQFLTAESDTAKEMLGEESSEYRRFQKELAELDFQRSIELRKNTQEGTKTAAKESDNILAINKQLRDKQDALITDKYARETKQAENFYADERARIDKDISDKEQHEKAVELLNTETANKLKGIKDEETAAQDKSTKNYTKVADILREINGLQKDNVSSAKEWGLVVGAVAAALIERIPNGTDTPSNLKKVLTPHGDTPGTLDSISGTIPLGNGQYAVSGSGKDMLVKKPSTPYVGPLDVSERKRAQEYRRQGMHHERGLEEAGALDPIEYLSGAFAGGGVKHIIEGELIKGVKHMAQDYAANKIIDTLTNKLGHGEANFIRSHKLQFSAMPAESTGYRGYEDGGTVGTDGASAPDPNTLWSLLNGKNPTATVKEIKSAALGILPDIVGAITYKSPPVQYNWNGSKKPQPTHSEGLGLLGKIAPIVANLVVPGSGVIVGPLLDSLGINTTGTKHSLFSSQGLAGLSGEGIAATGGVLSFLGLESGGYTGPGGKKQAAGVVHKGEFVFSADAVNRIGVGNLDSWHRSARGYESGGYVSNFYPYKTPPVHHADNSTALIPHIQELIRTVKNQNLTITSGDMQAYNNIGTQQIGLISG